jgi:site-specific DNA-methyltransferase (adenine-specific)
MARLDPGSVDMILTDLPYGTTQNAWDAVIPFAPMWEQFWRVLKPSGAVVLTATQPFSSALGASCLQHLRYSWSWLKPHTGQLNAKRMPLKNVEDVLVFYREQPTYNPQWREGEPYTVKRRGYVGNESYGAQRDHDTISDGRRYPMQDLRFGADKNKVHPTQKPVALFEYLIRTYTDEGETVLDVTAGSGTTGIAARNTGRNAILIERDPAYYAIAEQRLWPTAEEAAL